MSATYFSANTPVPVSAMNGSETAMVLGRVPISNDEAEVPQITHTSALMDRVTWIGLNGSGECAPVSVTWPRKRHVAVQCLLGKSALTLRIE
jgi:hypothetical protein